MFHKQNKLTREELEAKNNFFFDEIGITRQQSQDAYDEIARTVIPVHANDRDCFYRVAWAGLKVSGFKPKNILELGTYQGFSAVYLAHLFPEATIYTVELPEVDPLYSKFHPNQREYEEYIKNYLWGYNITLLRMNSIFLMSKELPQFDLIWIDAGHGYPNVAADHVYAINKLAIGGWLFSDDAMPPEDPINKGNPISQTIDYINQRNTSQFRYLLQRESPDRWLFDHKRGARKYIAFMRNNAE